MTSTDSDTVSYHFCNIIFPLGYANFNVKIFLKFYLVVSAEKLYCYNIKTRFNCAGFLHS